MAKKQTENAIQKHIIAWIRRALDGVEVIPIRNEDMRSRADEIVKGHPDLIIETVHAGICYTLKLELKAMDGKLSPIQKKWLANMERSINRQAEVAYGFNEAQAVILKWLGRVQGANIGPSSTSQKY